MYDLYDTDMLMNSAHGKVLGHWRNLMYFLQKN